MVQMIGAIDRETSDPRLHVSCNDRKGFVTVVPDASDPRLHVSCNQIGRQLGRIIKSSDPRLHVSCNSFFGLHEK